MHIRYGYTIEIETAQPTTLLTALDVETRRRGDIVYEEPFRVTGSGPINGLGSIEAGAKVDSFIDVFGNRCRRVSVGVGAGMGVESAEAGTTTTPPPVSTT